MNTRRCYLFCEDQDECYVPERMIEERWWELMLMRVRHAFWVRLELMRWQKARLLGIGEIQMTKLFAKLGNYEMLELRARKIYLENFWAIYYEEYNCQWCTKQRIQMRKPAHCYAVPWSQLTDDSPAEFAHRKGKKALGSDKCYGFCFSREKKDSSRWIYVCCCRECN